MLGASFTFYWLWKSCCAENRSSRRHNTSPCEVAYVPNPDVVSEFGLYELSSSIFLDDESHHNTFFVRTCLAEVDYSD